MSSTPGQPDTLILASNAHDLLAAGRIRAMRAVDSYDWSALAAFAHDDVPAPVVTHLGPGDTTGTKVVIVLDRASTDLTAAEKSALTAILGAGGQVLASGPVAALLAPIGATTTRVASASSDTGSIVRYATAKGQLFAVLGVPVERVFADSAETWASGTVQALFHKRLQPAGFMVSMGGVTLLYGGLGADGAAFEVSPPLPGSPATLAEYDTSGAVTRTIVLAGHTGLLGVAVPRRTYAMAVRMAVS